MAYTHVRGFEMATATPMHLIVEEGAEEEPMARAILEAFPETPRSRVSPDAIGETHEGQWCLRRHRGRFLKPCPGTREYLCCGYLVLNLVLGCPFKCVYCILPEYYGSRGLTVFVNLEDALAEVRTALGQRAGITRVGTGEMTDSLALEGRLHLAARLIPLFSGLPGGMLELKTKSIQVDDLLDLPHAAHTVLSWSLNPGGVIRRAEAGTPPLAARLEAAGRCQERGYPIGIHFDPVVWMEDWEDQYHALVKRVFQVLDPRSILWISLGGLRYPPSLRERLLPSGLGLAEFIPGLDGKLRYLRYLRARVFRSMVRWMREMGGDPFVYLCMEGPEVWREALGWAPRDMAELDREFQKRIRLFWGRAS